MGNSISGFGGSSQPQPQAVKALVVGYYHAGKTTLLYQLKNRNKRRVNEDVQTTMPMIGFYYETVSAVEGYDFMAWDLGGRDPIRQLWRKHYPTVECIILVVDSVISDKFTLHSNTLQALEEVKYELNLMLNEEHDLKDKPLLVFCNKQDLQPDALSPEEISKKLELEKIVNRKVIVVGCTATTGDGIDEGLNLLSQELQEIKNSKKNVGDEDDETATTTTEVTTRSFTTEEESPTTTAIESILGYHPIIDSEILERFSVIKNQTECPFAKASKIWGGALPLVDASSSRASIEEQAQANIKGLTEFCKRINNGEDIDGYCIELTNDSCDTPEVLGQSVRRLLTTLSDLDLTINDNIMKVKYDIGASKNWRFRFAKVDFFITTFARCYPKTSSRYSFGSPHIFVLFQPEISFLNHGLPKDTPHTNWTNPQTVRDKARVAYKTAGREYHIPTTTTYSVADHVVKPLVDDGNSVIRWWVNED